MPRRSRAAVPPPPPPVTLSPGDLVNHFETLPVEYAAFLVEIVQKRVEARRAAFTASVQQQPLMQGNIAGAAPGNPGQPAAAPPAPVRRRGRAAVPLVPPQDTVGDDPDADQE